MIFLGPQTLNPNSDHIPDTRPRLTPEAYASAWQQDRARVWALALGLLGHRADAEDLVQEAVVVGLQRLDQFQPDTRFVAWMGQIVRHLAMNHRRKKVRRQTQPSAELDSVAAEPEVSVVLDAPPNHRDGNQPKMYDGQDADAFGLDDDLHAGLMTLAPEARACLLMRTIHGMSYDDIAAIVGVPPGTAMSHVHRSRQRLRSMLSTQPEEVTR